MHHSIKEHIARYKELGEMRDAYLGKIYHLERSTLSIATGGSFLVRKIRIILLFALLLIPIGAFSTKQATALPFDNEYTDQTVNVDQWLYLDLSLTSGDEISGYFETHEDTQGLDFFIADEDDFTSWSGGSHSSFSESAENMHTYYWSLTIPYTDTWYLVFFNDDSETVTFDAGVDLNGDNTPYYDSSSYDYTEYGYVLENDEWVYLSGNLAAGTEISGHFSTFFTTDGVDFFICDETNIHIHCTYDWSLVHCLVSGGRGGYSFRFIRC